MGASDTTLQQAIAAHQAGHLDEADAAYREVLELTPNNPDALHFMGLLRFQSGDPAAAVQLIARSLDADPGNPNAWNNLANMLSLAGRVTEAQEAYRRVMSLAPERAEAYYNLALSLRDHDEPGQAVHYLQQAIVRSPNFFRAYETLAMLCYRLGDARGAAETYRVWSLRDPGNAKARHMAAATSGNNVPGRASDEYVRLVFDHVARGFDRNLANLGYRAPELVATALGEYAEVHPGALCVLDAGCGTGLCGPLIRRICQSLTGVDLSPRMLDLARQRAVYDELIVDELCSFMRSRAATFDAIISADTLVYFGMLDEALAAASTALRPAGVFIATFEALIAGGDANFQIQIHGRYAHRESYLRQSLARAGFQHVQLVRETLRQEKLQDVVGYLVVAEKMSKETAPAQ
jgi:predicted TPR repeat methyltransferase